MARNSEKNLTELNRLWLATVWEKEKKTERPRLESLKTAHDVRKWIPSIKAELFYCIRHLSGIRNYPDYKIKEFEERVDFLKREWKRWVAKCFELDPNPISFPGEMHGYISKKEANKKRSRVKPNYADMSLEEFLEVEYDTFVDESEKEAESRPEKITKLDTPLLDAEKDEPQFPELTSSGIDVNNYEDIETSMNRPLDIGKKTNSDNEAMKELLCNYSDSEEDVNKDS